MDKNDATPSLSHRFSVAGEGSSRGAYSGVAYTLGMPVDLINMGLKALHVPTSDDPVLGGKHIDRIFQKGLDFYYNRIGPALGVPPATLQDDTDKKVYLGSYVAGGLVGFGKATAAANATAKGAGIVIGAGGLAQLIDSAPQILSETFGPPSQGPVSPSKISPPSTAPAVRIEGEGPKIDPRSLGL